MRSAATAWFVPCMLSKAPNMAARQQRFIVTSLQIRTSAQCLRLVAVLCRWIAAKANTLRRAHLRCAQDGNSGSWMAPDICRPIQILVCGWQLAVGGGGCLGWLVGGLLRRRRPAVLNDSPHHQYRDGDQQHEDRQRRDRGVDVVAQTHPHLTRQGNRIDARYEQGHADLFP